MKEKEPSRLAGVAAAGRTGVRILGAKAESAGSGKVSAGRQPTQPMFSGSRAMVIF